MARGAGFNEEGPYGELTHDVIGAAIKVQRALGPWLLESAFQQCLAFELKSRGHQVEEQIPVGIPYGGLLVPNAYRMDLLVDDILIVEIKVVEAILQEHESQLMSYLRFTEKPIGLLIHFRTQPLIPKGLRRIIMSQFSSASSV